MQISIWWDHLTSNGTTPGCPASAGRIGTTAGLDM